MRKYAVLAGCLLLVAAASGQIELYTGGGSVVQYATIQDAVDAAINGDTVVIGEGVYIGTGNRDIAIAGKAVTIRSTDPNDPNCVANTIIDCQASETENHRGFYFSNGLGSNIVVAGLTIKNGYADNGGGMYLTDSNCTVVNCNFTNNQASGDGGAIVNFSSKVLVESCSFKNNTANSGGGVFFYSNSSNKSVLRNCVFKGNRAVDVGAAELQHCEVDSCVFTNNKGSVGNVVCAVYTQLNNCLVYENSGLNAVRLFNSSMTNSTVAYNNACGIANSLNHEMANCIVWSNNTQIEVPTNTNFLRCCIQGWDKEDANHISKAPIFVDTYNGDYRLMEYSPCIDAGDNSAVDMQTDMDGNPRISDGNGDGVDTVDIGAYEFKPVENETPGIKVSTNKLQFRYFSDANVPDAQQFEISNLGSGQVNWQITPDSNWVNVTPSCGTFDQDSNTITVTIDVNKLSKNSRVARLTVADVNDSCEPVEVRVYIYGFYGQGGQLIKVPEDYNNIQAAVDASSTGDTIVVADGLYTGIGNTDVNVIDLEITIAGRNGPENCVIDCNGNWENEHKAFCLDGTDDTATTIAGFKIMNSHFTGSNQRGAIGIIAGCPVIIDCNLYEEDWCPAWGSGIYGGNRILIANCQIFGFYGYALSDVRGEILDCDIVGNGLAIYGIAGGEPGLIQGCNISDNYREDLYNTCSGISNFYGDIVDCTIKGNIGALSYCKGLVKNCTIADSIPGSSVIYMHEGDLNLTNCIIKNNGSKSQYFRGGIIQFNNYPEPDVNIIGCEISGNYFRAEGAISNVTISIIDSKILNNTNLGYYAGVLNECDVNIVDSVIAGNYADRYSALYRCTGYISNCKIIGNNYLMYHYEDSAAIYDFDGDIEDCDISWNSSGGVDADANVVRCRFANNDGVGVYASTVSDCVAYGNGSTGLGGGQVTDCISIGNQGGGIFGHDIIDCIVKNNVGYGPMGIGGISCLSGGNVVNCIVQDNYGFMVGGIGDSRGSGGNIINCLVTGNKSNDCGGIKKSGATITNCTIVGNASRNRASGISISSCDVNNCIIWDNRIWENNGDVNQVYPSNSYDVIYCCIQGGGVGWGIIDVNPYFARAGYWNDNLTLADKSDDFWVQGDYHLKSIVGRYDEETQSWVRDSYSSFCIDTGYRGIHEDWADEPWPNGDRVNMGFYGGTAFASKSGNCAAAGADVNEDDKIDMRDFAKLAGHWLKTDLVEDPDSNGIINIADIQILAEFWLEDVY